MGTLRIGCGSWGRHGLERYAEEFNSVEVNATFYKLADLEAVKKWVEATPDDFEFSIKASRYMTHKYRLQETERLSQSFYAPLAPLVATGRMGPTLWQLPGNFRRDDERLAGAIAKLPPGRHCFEFRHESWFDDEVTEMLRERGIARVVGDTPERKFQSHDPTTDWMFVRFLHGTRGRRGNYSDSELDEWGERIAAWRQRGDVYAYFNNDGDGDFARRNAVALRERLGASGPAGTRRTAARTA